MGDAANSSPRRLSMPESLESILLLLPLKCLDQIPPIPISWQLRHCQSSVCVELIDLLAGDAALEARYSVKIEIYFALRTKIRA